MRADIERLGANQRPQHLVRLLTILNLPIAHFDAGVA
jgi:hypothetical protein